MGGAQSTLAAGQTLEPVTDEEISAFYEAMEKHYLERFEELKKSKGGPILSERELFMKILASHGTKLGVLKGTATKSAGAAMQVSRAVGLLKMKRREEGKEGAAESEDVDGKVEEGGSHSRNPTAQELSEAHKRALEEKAREGSKFPFGKAASVTGTSTQKAANLLGDARAIDCGKARKIIGDNMTYEQLEAMRIGSVAERKEEEAKKIAELHRILAELPSEAQKGFFGQYQISPKALEMMGDEELSRHSAHALPAHMKDHPDHRPNKKALEMLGSASLIPGKAVSLCGVWEIPHARRLARCASLRLNSPVNL